MTWEQALAHTKAHPPRAKSYAEAAAQAASERETLLFGAFLAGFYASGEGFNGEWLHERYRNKDALAEHLCPLFKAWLRGDAP